MASGAFLSYNFDVTYAPGNLTITPATSSVVTLDTVTVRANDIEISIGAAMPTITFTATGLKNGDAISNITYTIIPTFDSNKAGIYVVKPTGGTLTNSNRYFVKYEYGILSVKQ
jgi:hypothetical protein